MIEELFSMAHPRIFVGLCTVLLGLVHLLLANRWFCVVDIGDGDKWTAFRPRLPYEESILHKHLSGLTPRGAFIVAVVLVAIVMVMVPLSTIVVIAYFVLFVVGPMVGYWASYGHVDERC